MTQESLFPMPQEARTSDDYWTPKWVFDALGIEFDLDVACPPDGPAHTPAKKWYTQETDGLLSPWNGRIWMNPPYSHATPWVHKFIEHKHGVALLPFAKSRWLQNIWESADAITPLPSNLKFDQGTIMLPTFLAAFGNECVEAIGRVGYVR
jgi:phage N-6-adenine-methyltransferase